MSYKATPAFIIGAIAAALDAWLLAVVAFVVAVVLAVWSVTNR